MPFTFTLDSSVPNNNELVSLGAGRIRDLTGAMIERLNSFFVDANTSPLTAKDNAAFHGPINIPGTFTVNTSKFSVDSATGNVAFLGNLAVNTNKLTVDASTGNVVAAGTSQSTEFIATSNTSFVAPNTGIFAWNGRSQLSSGADGNILLTNAAVSAFSLLQLGGITNAFPALKRVSAGMSSRLADDSGDAAFTCAAFTATTMSGTSLTASGQLIFSRTSKTVAVHAKTLTDYGSVQNISPTAAECFGGLLKQSNTIGAGQIQMPTGAALSGLFSGVAVGDTFETNYINIGNSTMTVVGGNGVTQRGLTSGITPARVNKWIFINTGSNTWDVWIMAFS